MDAQGRASTNPPWGRCTGHLVLSAGEPVRSWRLGAIHFLSARVGVGVSAPTIPCVVRTFAGGIDVASEPQPVLLTSTVDGGRDWRTEGVAAGEPLPSAIEDITATSTRTVWLATGVGPALATTDAGRNWTVQPVPGPVGALTITRRTLWALGCPHTMNVDCRPVLAHRSLPGWRWLRSPLPRPVSTVAAELVVPAPGTVGGTGQLVDRLRRQRGRREQHPGATSFHGRRSHVDDRPQVTSLTAPQPPHGLARGPITALAAATPRRLWLASTNTLEESDDAGASWRRLSGVKPEGGLTAFDVLSPTHAWLLSTGQGIWRTTDGRHWHAL